MPFYDLSNIQAISLVNGITVKTAYSENLSLAYLSLPAFSRIPTHHHENDQIGIVLEGEVEYTIGEETKLCSPGTIVVVPSNEPHSLVVVSSQTAKFVDVFTPPRKFTGPSQYTEE